jgi:hypothetical protein
MASNTETHTMSTMIEEVLDTVYRTTERPLPVFATATATANATTLTVSTLATDSMSPADVIEFGRELILVTAVASGSITVSRGYAGTTAAAIANGDQGWISSDFPRREVDRAIRRCIDTLQSTLPLLTSKEVDSDKSGDGLIELPSNTMDVDEVELYDQNTNSLIEMRGTWRFRDMIPKGIINSTKAVVIPRSYRDCTIVVTYRIPYTWVDGATDEADTITLPLGGAALPVDFAVAKLQTGREVSRQEFDQIEEWNQVEAARRGQNIRMIQTLWGIYYQRLDEVKSTRNAPRKLSFKRHVRSVPASY